MQMQSARFVPLKCDREIADAEKVDETGSNAKMRVFVTGVGGQLGHDVINEVVKRGYEGIGSDLKPVYSGVQDGSAVTSAPYVALDITDRESVMCTITDIRPDVIVHCAAWTAVDAAEDPEKKPLVRKINVEGTQNMADAAKAVDAKIVYLSTDYVFDGQGTMPWQPDDKNYEPLNYYGETKLEGELAVSNTTDKFFIVRIAWVFGLNGSNFIKTMLNVGSTHDTVRVVNDQIGSPTYCCDLARLLVDMIGTDKYGYYHATNEGDYISWYDFACEIFRQAKMDTKVIPVTTEEYGLSKAVRPHNSRLDRSKLKEAGFTALPPWQDAVARYLKEKEAHPDVSVVIPTLNAERYIYELLESLHRQSLQPCEIIVVDSDSDDRTAEICRNDGKVSFVSIKREDFDHGETRDKAVRQCKGKYVVFFSQDALPADDVCLARVTEKLGKNGIAVCTGRQVAREYASTREKLIRSYNYPQESNVRSEKDKTRLGIKTYFCSNSFSAYDRKIYLDLDGFDYPLLSNEDMFFAAKAINSGYKAAYCADAKVYHSHDHSLAELFMRNFREGYEIERHKAQLGDVSLESEGLHMVRYVGGELLRHGRVVSFVRFGIECTSRLLGNRLGRRKARKTEQEKTAR